MAWFFRSSSCAIVCRRRVGSSYDSDRWLVTVTVVASSQVVASLVTKAPLLFPLPSPPPVEGPSGLLWRRTSKKGQLFSEVWPG